jgi:phosphoribulokinase
MSVKHPIVAITGSSGAGTTSVTKTLQHIFRRESLSVAIVEGDSFHRYDRKAMTVAMEEAEKIGNKHFSHFGPETNLLEELEALFRDYGIAGRGKARKYLHNEEEAELYGQEPGTFTPWEDIAQDSDMHFCEGLHGAVVTPTVNVAQHADLLVGVVPIITSSACRRWTPPTPSSRASSRRRTKALSSSVSPTRRASISPTCYACCTTLSCRARTSSWSPAGRWSWLCS